jgi:hypothetical protein
MASILVVSAFAVGGAPSSGLASESHSASYVWRADARSPLVVDYTGSGRFWRIADAVREWSDLDANVNPKMTDESPAHIVVVERRGVRWLGRSEVLVQDGFIVKARILLNAALRRAPNGRAIADHVLCHEMGRVLGLRSESARSCMSARHLGQFAAPGWLDEMRLAKLYSTASSSVSTDPGVKPGPAKWVTVHVFEPG